MLTNPTSPVEVVEPVDVILAASLPAGSNLIGSTTPLGNVANAATDSGNPNKIGYKAAVSALATAVTNGQRVDAAGDRYGRILTTEVDFGAVLANAATYTTAQTGTALLTPASGKVIIVLAYFVTTFAVTAGRVVLWWGASADTTYTEGSDRAIFDGNLTPTTSATPGTNIGKCFEPADAADRRLRVTTDTTISVRIGVRYIEVTP